jgi:transposase
MEMIDMEVIMTVKAYKSVKELLKLAKSQTNARLARRIQAVVLAQQGYTCVEIAQMTAHSRRAIQSWVAKYNARSIDGLKEQHRSGRKPNLPSASYELFSSRIDAGPTKNDAVATLYGKSIQKILNKEFGVVYSLNGVYQLLHRLGYSYLAPRPRHQKANIKVQQDFKKTSGGGWKV